MLLFALRRGQLRTNPYVEGHASWSVVIGLGLSFLTAVLFGLFPA